MGGFRVRVAVMLLLAAMPTCAVACTPNGDSQADDDAEFDTAAVDGDSPRSSEITGSLHVLVAASLIPVAEALADEFRSAHPLIDVMISGAGSSALREQVLAGAPADVFIPADPAHLDAVDDEIGLDGEPVVVARNSLVLAVPVGNEVGVDSLADLSRSELLIGLCAIEVPCGALARAGLAAAGIEARPDTDEPNVRALVTKLARGELDAAVVYASDAHRSREAGSQDAPAPDSAITSLGWPGGSPPQARYAAAVLADALNPAAGAQFVAFLQSDPARATFLRYGFIAP